MAPVQSSGSCRPTPPSEKNSLLGRQHIGQIAARSDLNSNRRCRESVSKPAREAPVEVE